MKYSFKKLLKEISVKGIEIKYNNGKLMYTMPEECYSDDLRDAIKCYKAKLISHLFPLESNSNLMILNKGGEKTPFFLINGEYANYFIKDALGKDRPYYGFLHLGSGGERIPFKDTRIMAENFVNLLKKEKPNGPYILGGFSFGGILAFEMANILQSQGHKVELVVLFDTNNVGVKEPFVWHNNLYKIIRSNILSPTYYFLLGLCNRSISEFFLFFKALVPVRWRNKYILHKYQEISKTFNPTYFDGDILLFRVEESLHSSPNLGWAGFSNNLNVVPVKGKHAGFLSNPNSIEIIKSTIKETLDRLEKNNKIQKYS